MLRWGKTENPNTVLQVIVIHLLLSRLGSHFRALDLFLALGTAYDFEMQNCSTSADWLALEEGVVALESRRSDAIIQCLKNSLRLTEAVKNTRTS